MEQREQESRERTNQREQEAREREKQRQEKEVRAAKPVIEIIDKDTVRRDGVLRKTQGFACGMQQGVLYVGQGRLC